MTPPYNAGARGYNAGACRFGRALCGGIVKRIVVLAFVVMMLASVAADAGTTVDVQTTGASHGVIPGLAVRGRYERRDWDLDLKTISPANAALSASLDDMRFDAELSSLGAELLFSVGRRVELRAIVAATDAGLDGWRGGVRLDVDTGLGLLYGFGVRFSMPALWPPGWDFDVDFELLRGSFNNADLIFTGGGPLGSASQAGLDWRQFSVTPTISKHFRILTPYAGLRFATADADLDVLIGAVTETLSFENEDLLSVVVGTRFSLGSMISGDVHVDLLNNEGVVVSVVVRF